MRRGWILRGEGGRGGAHDRLRGFSRRFALAGALIVASIPAKASAGPLPPEIRERLEALYTAGAEALKAGDPARAAASYAEVLEVLPEEEGSHGGRALALADAVEAYRAAFEASSEDTQLCAALALTAAYAGDLEERYGDAFAEMDGGRLAAELGAELAVSMAEGEVLCETDRLEPESEPEPEPESAPLSPGEGESAPSPWLVGGGIGLGLGGVLLGVMAGGLAVGAGASRDAAALREEMPGLTVDDPAFDEVLRRGVRGNRLAWAAGVGAGVALLSGALLLGVGLRGDRRRPHSEGARTARLGIGRGIVVRF